VQDRNNPTRLFAASVTKPSLWEFDMSQGECCEALGAVAKCEGSGKCTCTICIGAKRRHKGGGAVAQVLVTRGGGHDQAQTVGVLTWPG
jgi:hypothetical protein